MIAVSLNERRRWLPPYQTGKTVQVHAKHYKHNKDGRTAPGVCGNGSVPLSHSGNVVTRIGKHTHILSVCEVIFADTCLRLGTETAFLLYLKVLYRQ